MSGFPAYLQVGQGATPNELDIDQFPKSRHPKLFRDRDEYVMSIVKDGASAPELVSVSAIRIQGQVVAVPQVERRIGLSVANGSYSLNADFRAWRTHPETWKQFIVNKFTLDVPKRALVTANFGYFKNATYGAVALYRLLVDGIPAALVNLTRDWESVTGAPQVHSFNGTLNWAGLLAAGTHSIMVQFFLYTIAYGRAAHMTDASPALTVILI